MTLIEAFNLINNVTSNVPGTREDHEKIKQALDCIAPLINSEIQKQQDPEKKDPEKKEAKK